MKNKSIKSSSLWFRFKFLHSTVVNIIVSINYFNMSFVQVEEQAQVGGKGDHWHHQLANEAPSRGAAEMNMRNTH